MVFGKYKISSVWFTLSLQQRRQRQQHKGHHLSTMFATRNNININNNSSLFSSRLSLFLIRLWKNLCGSTLAHGLDNLFVLDVVLLVGLELDSDTAERALEGLLGGGVDHLGLFYFGGSQLVRLARFGKFIF